MKLNRPLAPQFEISPLLGSSRRLLRAGLLIGAFGVAHAAQAQAIYSITEQAGPSETLSARGDALGNSTTYSVYPYDSAGNRLAAVTCTTQSSNGSVALFNLPSTIANTVYEVAANTPKGVTNSVFVNRPRMEWSDVSEAMPDNAVRLIGRNFKPATATSPTVTLTNSSTRIAYTATIDSANDNAVTFRVPSNVPAGAYKISINNNLAGTASLDPNTLPLTVKPKANDPFGLDVSWGAEFAGIASRVYNAKTDSRLPIRVIGDGVADDCNRLASLIWWVQQNGGGTVYLPAGTYRVDSGGAATISIPPNVVLRGAGKGTTVLQVGYGYTPSNAPDSQRWPISLWGENQGYCGIIDMTIENLNSNAQSSNVLRGGTLGLTSPKVFLKNVDFKLNNGTNVWLTCPRKAIIADCNFTSTSLSSPPVYLQNSRELQFVRNRVDYRAGRFGFIFGQKNVFDGNTIQINNDYRTPDSVETGGLELSYGQQILVQNNTIGCYGTPTKVPYWDGELILNQLSGLGEFAYVGMVKSVSGRILVPQDSWPTTAWIDNQFDPTMSRKIVMIISGKGAGQWRWAQSWTTRSVTLDRNWQTVPDSTSRYAIASMNCYQQTLINNQLTAGNNGVSLYNGGFDSVVAGNTQTNSGALLVRESCGDFPLFSGNYAFAPAWDVSVTGNTVTDTNGYLPGSIAVGAVDIAGQAFGALALNVDVRRNKVFGCNLPPRPYELCQMDGIEISTIFHSGVRLDTTVNAGTIVQSNVVLGSSLPIQLRWVGFGELDNDIVTAVTGR